MKNTAMVNDQVSGYESAMIAGDLSKLSADQRLEYYAAVCKSVGLNALTKPFDYITLNGKLVLYAKRDATDQLRASRGVSISIVNRETIGDVYVVTARATIGDRSDESTGAVPIGNVKGEALANALMKAETKAKRRVTLSICGLGMLDETELETIPEARAMPQQGTKKLDLEKARSWVLKAKTGEDAEDRGAICLQKGFEVELVSQWVKEWGDTHHITESDPTADAMENAIQAAMPAKGFIEANQ